MVNSALQVVGFCLAVFTFALDIVCCAIPRWKKSDIQNEVIEAIIRTSGLWARCQHQSTGQYACDDYDTFFLGLPSSLQAARGLTCVAIACCFIAMILGIFGLSCTNIASDNPAIKAKMVLAGGVNLLISGLAIGIAVSWFAANVLREYQAQTLFNPNDVGNRYVYGEALFVGWCGMVTGILGGALMCCSSWNADEEDTGRSYHYNPPKHHKAAAEYI